MIVTDEGERVTPTLVAKAAIEHASYMAVEMPLGTVEHMIEVDQLTPGETRRIEEAIRTQYDRVRKLMGMEPL